MLKNIIILLLCTLTLFGYSGNKLPFAAHYVSATASGGGLGTELNPFTFSEAVDEALAGDIVWVKAGDYGSITKTISSNGSSGNEIKFIGYKTTPGDIVSTTYSTFSYGDALDSSEMPLFTGTSQTSTNGLTMNGNYIHIENIQLTNYVVAFDSNGDNNYFKNIIITDCGNLTDYDSYSGKAFNISGTGSTLENSYVENVGAEAILLINATYTEVLNSEVHCDNDENPIDYYCLAKASDYDDPPAYNLFDGVRVFRYTEPREGYSTTHTGHFGFKGSSYNIMRNFYSHRVYVETNFATSHDNLFENGIIRGKGGRLALLGARDNTYRNIYLIADSDPTLAGTGESYTGISITTQLGDSQQIDSIATNHGPRGNTFENIFVKGHTKAISIGESSVDGTVTYKGNDFNNITFEDCGRISIYNDVIDYNFKNISWSNSIGGALISASGGKTISNWDWQNSNFYGNGFTAPTGTNITTVDPKYSGTGTIYEQFQLASDSPLINSGVVISGRDEDIDENPIVGTPDVGAFEYREATEPTETVPTITLTTKKGFPDLWGERADEITGGRGGIPFFITSLADTNTATYVAASGGAVEHYTGTFRGAMNLNVPRQIYPRISGKVNVASDLFMDANDGDFTYHGHMAPEGGLSLTENNLRPWDLENVIFRFLRYRLRNTATAAAEDVAQFYDSAKIAIDHGSFGWSGDEIVSLYPETVSGVHTNIFQYTLFTQARDGHNTGSISGYTNSGTGHSMSANYHMNVFSGMTHRTPNVSGDSNSEFRIYNNVTYDWEYRLSRVYFDPKVDKAYNYNKKGPTNPPVDRSEYDRYDSGGSGFASIWSAYNFLTGELDGSESDNSGEWSVFGSGTTAVPSGNFRSTMLPIDTGVGYTPITAAEAYTELITNREVGANRSVNSSGVTVFDHDSIDDFYLDAVENGTTARIAEVSWIHPAVASTTPYTDANWNGIPDVFEDAHGITSADQVIVTWNFGSYQVINNAGYTAEDISSAYYAGDFDRMEKSSGPSETYPGGGYGNTIRINRVFR